MFVSFGDVQPNADQYPARRRAPSGFALSNREGESRTEKWATEK
jgi:hypothetical protein